MDEITALRARIAAIEARALRDAPRIGLETALEDHYSPTRPPVDHKTRDLRNAAHGWQPDPQQEAAIAARQRDPAAHAAAMAAMHESGLPLALYERGRAAALALNPDALKETK